jgi:TonB family protein
MPHGEVVVQFVVDTTGRPDMRTLKVLQSSDDLFSESVRRALLRYRFFPAEIAGRKVRQLVKMPFIFSVMSPI